MQISGIGKQLLAPLSLERYSADDPKATVEAATADRPADDFVARAVGPRFHQILSKYDVTDITPAEFSNLAQELRDAGEITDEEFRDLAKIRLELEQQGAVADEPLDLVTYFENKLAEQRADLEQAKTNGPASIAGKLDDRILADAKRQLDWVRKFALVHDSGAAAVDLGA